MGFDRTDPASRLAAESFVNGFSSPNTRAAYTRHLQSWFDYCDQMDVSPLEAKRPHVEGWARWLEHERHNKPSSVAAKMHAVSGFYRLLFEDEVIDKNPMRSVRRPRVAYTSTTNGLTRTQLADLIKAAQDEGPMYHALVCLLGLNGLRVSEACGIRIEHLTVERYHRAVKVTRKGAKVQTIPLAPVAAWAVDAAKGDREEGPLLLNTLGRPMDAKAAWRAVKRLARKVEIPVSISPHSFRHAFVTVSLDAGVSERDIMNSTGHADLRQVSYYDRARDNIDRNATHALTAFVMGAG